MQRMVEMKQTIDDEERVVAVPESSVRMWVRSGWVPKDPPSDLDAAAASGPVEPVAPVDPYAEEPAPTPPAEPKTRTTKKES